MRSDFSRTMDEFSVRMYDPEAKIAAVGKIDAAFDNPAPPQQSFIAPNSTGNTVEQILSLLTPEQQNALLARLTELMLKE